MTTQEFNSKGAAWKMTFILSAMEQQHLAKQKDIVAMAPDRDTALELKQNIIDEIEVFDHNVTGTMENSIGVRKMGDEYGITAIDYAKYVNGRDRENEGEGFIDAAVNQTILDTGEDIYLLV